MKLILTGATGMCGRSLMPLLLKDERIEEITALCRAGSARALQEQYGHEAKLSVLTADLAHPETLPKMPEADVLVHMAALKPPALARHIYKVNLEATSVLLKRAEDAGIKRFIFISTINIDLHRHGPYARSKLDAENLLRSSKLDCTIVRPHHVYGSPYDTGGLAKALAFIRTHSFMPVFGNGQALEQPIHVDDLARYLHILLTVDKVPNPLYLAGADALPYNKLILSLTREFKLNCRLIHLPAAPFRLAALAGAVLGLTLPLSAEMIDHQCEDLPVDTKPQISCLNHKPLTFAEGLTLWHRTLTEDDMLQRTLTPPPIN